MDCKAYIDLAALVLAVVGFIIARYELRKFKKFTPGVTFEIVSSHVESGDAFVLYLLVRIKNIANVEVRMRSIRATVTPLAGVIAGSPMIDPFVAPTDDPANLYVADHDESFYYRKAFPVPRVNDVKPTACQIEIEFIDATAAAWYAAAYHVF